MANQVDVIQTDTTTDIPALVGAIPTNPMLDTEDGSSFTSLPDVTLANGAHGGAAATLTLSDYSDFLADVSGLATAAKLLKYIQLLARSDAAIETDNATELTEINADEGSGAGNFSSQTDAVEAIKDSLEGSVDAGFDNVIAAPTAGSAAWWLLWLGQNLVTKQIITEANGNTEFFNRSDGSLGSVAARYATDGTYTTRKLGVL